MNRYGLTVATARLLVERSPTAVAVAMFVTGVVLNLMAWSTDNVVVVVALYHVGFGLLVCIVLPTWYQTRVRRRRLAEIGLSSIGWRRNTAIGAVIALLTVPWRLPELTAPTGQELLCLTVALGFSTLFEEVFFRGFLQTTIERATGTLPAIVFSGAAFSIYHIGYGDQYRHLAMLGKMTLVGMMFAVAFRLTGSVWTSIALNWPHAIVTFVEGRQRLDVEAATVSLLVAVAAILWLWYIGQSLVVSNEE